MLWRGAVGSEAQYYTRSRDAALKAEPAPLPAHNSAPTKDTAANKSSHATLLSNVQSKQASAHV